MMTADDPTTDDVPDNPIADFFRRIPSPLFVAFVAFVWAGSLYQSLEPYELGPIVTYGLVIVTAIPVGIAFERLRQRI